MCIYGYSVIHTIQLIFILYTHIRYPRSYCVYLHYIFAHGGNPTIQSTRTSNMFFEKSNFWAILMLMFN